MESAELAIVAGLLLAYAAVSGRLSKSIVTAPMVFIFAGVVLGPEGIDVLELGIDEGGVLLLAEATLAIVLFSDASRLDVQALRHEAGLPVRMLVIGLPLTIGASLLGILVLLSDLEWQQAGLLAAILVPTDAALGQAVVSERRVPKRIRQTLEVESGLNDGLALPAVTIFLTLAEASEAGRSAAQWVRFAAEQIGYGSLCGIAVGAVGGWALCRSRQVGWLDGIAGQLGGLALAGLAFGLAGAVDGNGFIAAFTAGLAFKAVGDETAEHLTEYAEDTGALLALVAFLVFGNVLVGPVLDALTWQIALCAVGTLTVARIVPVAVSLIGMHLRWPSVLFLGWFGPRGLASVLFALIVLEESDLAIGEEVFAVVAWTVILSVVAHGVTARWGAQRYADWYESHRDHHHAMPEST